MSIFVKKENNMETKKIINSEYFWIIKVLRSCTNKEQIGVTKKLFNNFLKKRFSSKQNSDEKVRYEMRFYNKIFLQENKIGRSSPKMS